MRLPVRYSCFPKAATFTLLAASDALARLGPDDESPHPPTATDIHNDRISMIIGYTWIALFAVAVAWLCWWAIRTARTKRTP